MNIIYEYTYIFHCFAIMLTCYHDE